MVDAVGMKGRVALTVIVMQLRIMMNMSIGNGEFGL